MIEPSRHDRHLGFDRALTGESKYGTFPIRNGSFSLIISKVRTEDISDEF